MSSSFSSQTFVRNALRRESPLIGASMLCLFAEVAFRLLEPWPLKIVFDYVIAPPAQGSAKASGSALTKIDPMVLLAGAAGAVILIAGLRALATYYRRVGFALAGGRVLADWRAELFAHLQRLSLSFYNASRTGDLITRVTGDIGRVKEVVITAAMPLLAHLITLVGMMAVMLWMNWQLSLVALLILPMFALASTRTGKRIRTVAREQRRRQGEIGATAAETIGSIKVVQAMSLEGMHEKTFGARNAADLNKDVKAKRLSARLIGTTEVLLALGSAVVLWYGGRLVLAGALTAGDLIVFLAYLKSALRPIRNMAKYSGRIAKASASAERIIEVLETTPVISNRPGATAVPAAIETVSFRDVTFGYKPGQHVLEDFCLDADRGRIIAIAGPSGAGKSTVLNLLLRLYDPLAGAVSFNERDIRDFTVESVRRAITIVPQENILFHTSIRDNIAAGAPDAGHSEIVAAATIARAHEFISALPDGYDTIVAERGQNLSEGQRQRIAIARAAVRKASILVLDEPTSSLDNHNNQLIREAIEELSRDRITFMVAHDLSLVARADLIVYLENGRIVERGNHDELISLNGRYAASHRLQRNRPESLTRVLHAPIG